MMKWQNKIDAAHIPLKVICAVVALINMIITVLCVDQLNAVIFYCALIFSIALFISTVAIKDVKSKIFKLVLVLDFTYFVLIFGWFFLGRTGVIAEITDIDNFKKIIKQSGAFGIVVFFLLTLLQVVVLPIPAAVTVLLGVVIYGPWVSFIVSVFGTVIGSFICFWLGRLLGKSVVAWIVGEEKTEKYAQILGEKGKIFFVLMMIFPFFPDDLICMAAGLTKMSFKFFVISVTISRGISVAILSFFGTGKIIPFSGAGIPIWIALFVLTGLCVYLIGYFIKKREKQKENAPK